MNFCARSVVTCDSHLSAGDIMIPRSIALRLTSPIVVQAFNRATLERLMRRGEVLFVQRAGAKLRSINHLAIQNLVLADGDCLVRRGCKHPLGPGRPHPPFRLGCICAPPENKKK